jgi:hypothetical protein
LLATLRAARGGHERVSTMGRSILLLFLGVPIPIIILIALFMH